MNQVNLKTRTTPSAQALATKYTRRNRPFGWQVAANGELFEHPREQEALRIVIDRREDGWTNGMIADELNERGYVTQRKKPWNIGAVSYVWNKLEDKPFALREGEKSLREDDVASLRIVTEKLDKDGNPESITVEPFDAQDALQEILEEAEIAALERLDADTNALVQRWRDETSDRVLFTQLGFGTGGAMLPQPKRTVVHKVVRTRWSSVKEALDAIPAGAATEQKKSLMVLYNAMVREIAVLRSQNYHMKQRLESYGKEDADAKQAAVHALEDMKSAILREWGVLRRSDLSEA
jgi:hypothetical protein